MKWFNNVNDFFRFLLVVASCFFIASWDNQNLYLGQATPRDWIAVLFETYIILLIFGILAQGYEYRDRSDLISFRKWVILAVSRRIEKNTFNRKRAIRLLLLFLLFTGYFVKRVVFDAATGSDKTLLDNLGFFVVVWIHLYPSIFAKYAWSGIVQVTVKDGA